MSRRHVKARAVSEARRAAMAALRRGTAMTCREIGALMGGVGPTAVLHGAKAAAANPALLRRAEACRRRWINYS